MRVFFTNLGCKLNQAELEKLAREFHHAGHQVVDSLGDAELHVINSCTVTHRAARDSRKIARRGARRRSTMRTVLTGCYATGSAEEAARLAGVDLVVTNDRKHELLRLVHEAFPECLPQGAPRTSPEAPREPPPFVPLAFGNTRTLVKIEDGCNMRCAFCIIPSTRGRQHSRPLPEVVAEVRSMAAQGFREVVVTGVQISHYRWQGRTLHDLATALLEETPVPRIRLTSLAPWAFDRRLLALLGHPRVCRHVHMSLQSGCDATLDRMRRPYSSAEYRALVEEIRRAVPGIAITTDVIVGFPGETAAELDASRSFVESMGFSRVHVFSYSPRPGTEAEELPGQVDPATIKARAAAMIEAAAVGERRFRERHVGETLPVLWEEERDGRLLGTSDNYLRVAAPVPAGDRADRLAGELTATRIVGLSADGSDAAVRGSILAPLTSRAAGAAGAAGTGISP